MSIYSTRVNRSGVSMMTPEAKMPLEITSCWTSSQLWRATGGTGGSVRRSSLEMSLTTASVRKDMLKEKLNVCKLLLNTQQSLIDPKLKIKMIIIILSSKGWFPPPPTPWGALTSQLGRGCRWGGGQIKPWPCLKPLGSQKVHPVTIPY